MKKLLALFFFACIVISCHKDNDDPQHIIVGRWQVTEATEHAQVNGMELKDYLISTGKSETEAQAEVDGLNESNFSVSNESRRTYQFDSDGRLTVYTTSDRTLQAYGAWTFAPDGKTMKLAITSTGITIFLNDAVKKITKSELQLDAQVDSLTYNGASWEYFILSSLQKE